MKPRSSAHRSKHGSEFKGVVKKITGKLTNRPDLLKEGRAEMAGKRGSQGKRLKNPDPHRRG